MAKNIGIILAGGVGSRMGLGYPKQFSKIAGKTALEHTVSIFQNHDEIDEIIIVSEKNHHKQIQDIVAQAGFDKVNRILFGGKERTDSTLSAIQALQDEPADTKLIIHDAVRPLLAAEVIHECIAALETFNAVDVAIPATDTIVHVNNETREIINIPPRKEYYQGQTPQAFRLGTLKKAYEIYAQSGEVHATCDCGIVLKTLPDEKVGIVGGSETNIKLTRPVDLFIADKLFQSRSHFTLRNITSLERLQELKGKVLVVFGGSYGIGADIIKLAQQFGAKTYGLSRSSGVDVTDFDAIQAALKQIHDTEKYIDFVVNTAAVLVHKPLALMSRESVEGCINVNYMGMVNVAMAAYPYLKESHGGFLSFASSSYTRGRPFYSIYSSTKAAIVNLTQALSEEWQPENININCINPERTQTPMRSKAFGIEPEGTLLDSRTVALASLAVLVSKETGNVINVVMQDQEYIQHLLDDLTEE
ncbi:bifunctional cytidylyltransferase/SDR family oxidoreductase [Wielerella bovis]|uniref:bifunctional cytidylyltransferase/SDR family oxidoreductase n=1 Tax=Wielerella bovis TaxID=2917790 RepID=UPI00201874A8|nr:bifunctional cytidylyltransferase/SDR family oxidoreductase [Wielerella bovis]MCG7656583.1 bifunctional cytidylyltransferase/SDR family oxidoreductase [Wielerella bovis]MCG7658808.1 bifunctional cytidylyltransferase/SDR family oxidoreductase [Wielerella bovis]ULJ69901.1 bifunctional cytidylyltransferase/SDR family oxidoreductase [Wielerella bovis]